MSSSEFFDNIFSTQCTESRTGIVELVNVPLGAVQRVVRWCYEGDLEFDDSEFMTLYYLSRYLGITQLERDLRAHLDSVITAQNVLDYCSQCYENGYSQELMELDGYLVSFLDSMRMDKVSQVLDVATFARILKASGLANARKVEFINVFIGDYKTNRDEEEALASCLTRDATLRPLLIGKDYSWTNRAWVSSLPGK
jgi:hypothetical protein